MKYFNILLKYSVPIGVNLFFYPLPMNMIVAGFGFGVAFCEIYETYMRREI